MRAFLRFLILLLISTTVIAQTNYTNDAPPDREPAMIRAMDGSGAVTTATVSIKYVTEASILYGRNYFVTKDNTTTYTGELPRAGVKQSVDPYLWQDQNTSGPAPRRLYCAGIVNNGNLSGGTGGTENNKVVVWRSGDLGRTWSNPVVVESSQNPPVPVPGGVQGTMVDKPTVTVGSYVSSRGYVYVAYMRIRKFYPTGGTDRTYYDIMAARSTDGGLTFETPVIIATSGDDQTFTNPSNSAHVIVSPGNGYVYVTWAHYTSSTTTQTRIMLARSPASGTVAGTWVVDSSGPMGILVYKANINGGESGFTVPFARYNWVSNKIGVVWHEREASGSSKVDVYYAEKGGSGWTTWGGQKKLKITDNPSLCSGGATTDQWYPSLDFNSTGTFTISWYDRSVDCTNNTLYDMFYAKIGTSGTVTQSPTRLTFNLWSLADIAGPPLISRGTGEYHTLWCETSTCYTAYVGSPAAGTTSDIFVSTIP